VIESFVQVCLPKSIGQIQMIPYVLAKWDQIPSKSMSALEHRSQ